MRQHCDATQQGSGFELLSFAFWLSCLLEPGQGARRSVSWFSPVWNENCSSTRHKGSSRALNERIPLRYLHECPVYCEHTTMFSHHWILQPAVFYRASTQYTSFTQQAFIRLLLCASTMTGICVGFPGLCHQVL